MAEYERIQRINVQAVDCYTPNSATDTLLPYLRKDWTIWEACYGTGIMARRLSEHGLKVVGEQGADCFRSYNNWDYDAIITNPPYSPTKLRNNILELLIELNVPFALLLRNSHLGGVASSKLLRADGIQVAFLDRRVDFIDKDGIPFGGNTFENCWVARGIFPKPIQWLEYDNKEK